MTEVRDILDRIDEALRDSSPAPWQHGTGYEQQEPGDYVADAAGDVVVSDDSGPKPADAKLIAAAPALLKEAREMIAHLRCDLFAQAATHKRESAELQLALASALDAATSCMVVGKPKQDDLAEALRGLRSELYDLNRTLRLRR